MNRALDKCLLLSGMAAPVIFVVVLAVLGQRVPGYNHLDRYISEFGAVDSPVRNEMNVFGFLLFGLLMLAFSIGVHRTFGTHWSGKTGAVLLAAGSVSLASVAFFPCDPGCVNVTPTGQMHNLASDTPFYTFFLACVFLGIQMTRNQAVNRRWLGAFAGVGIVTAIFAFAYLNLETARPGLVQRVAMATPLSVMAVAAVYLYSENFPKKAG